MPDSSKTIALLMTELGRLPGIGRRSAERIIFHLLKEPQDRVLTLAEAIRALRLNVHPCKVCFNLTEQPVCDICADDRRDRSTLCIVERPRDLITLEHAAVYRGLYHVLMGEISPQDGIGEGHLTIDPLLARLASGAIREVIMATNPTVEGDGTALRLGEIISQKFPALTITRLARGIAVGANLEFANTSMLADALSGRRQL
jgi:recombination protein RecR